MAAMRVAARPACAKRRGEARAARPRPRARRRAGRAAAGRRRLGGRGGGRRAAGGALGGAAAAGGPGRAAQRRQCQHRHTEGVVYSAQSLYVYTTLYNLRDN